MKKHGILNSTLSGALATLGHGDLVVVADCGLPRPFGSLIVDLAIVPGMPPFTAILDALLDELVVESAQGAEECRGGPVETWILERLPATDFILHEQLKSQTAAAKIIVRTGEATPYANIILRCGVPF